jgi:predicted CXXCH cytochrome family protein
LGLGVLAAFVLQTSPRAASPAYKGKTQAYARSSKCWECHQVDYALWTQSHHAQAEYAAVPANCQAAFDPTRSLKHGTETTTTRIQNGEYQVVTLGIDSNRQPFRVDRVIGVDPLRQFLTPAPGGRWQVQEASYDPKSNQWFYVYGADLRYPGEFGHWTGRGMNWNSFCAGCHNTNLKKNYDIATDSYHTTRSEMGVGCEACHGPLKNHIEWRRTHPQTNAPDPTLSPMNRTQVLDYCGTCHSRALDLTGNFKPGDSFYDHYALEMLDDSQKWYPDGQIHDEDYEFDSLLSSRMGQDGIMCLDCHNPHTGKNLVDGNDLCMRCHTGGYPKAPTIDPAEHGHHKLTDHGSDCVGCHMPVTVYMQRHPRRDHGFTIPDPLLTRQLGIPNACNRCHADKSTDWALKYVVQWYGPKMNRPTRSRAQWIAAAENGDSTARPPLLNLLADTNQSPYWQAVTVHFLGQWADEPATKAALLKQLTHPHPLVRARAAQSLEAALSDPEVTAALQKTLDDPVLSVRLAAAWTLRATLDMQSRAGREFQQALDVDADQPTGQFKAAMFLLARQHVSEALPHLEKAAAWDPISPPYQCVRAQVLDELGQTAKALDILTREETAIPDDAHTPYVRATILARHGRYAEARLAANRAVAIQRDFQPALELLREMPGNH